MVILLLVLLGLCLGSFANALVWRVYKQEFTGNSKERKNDNYSILKGRSMCVNCQHTLAWYDLLPVISWLTLKGKCRYCYKPISWQYPLVEILTAGLFVVSYLHWPNEFSTGEFAVFGLWLVLLTGFIALSVFDLRWMLLPNRIVFPLQIVAVVYVLARFTQSGGEWIVLGGTLVGVMGSAGVFYALFQISGGKWIGGGDVKLAVVLGLVLGSGLNALLMLFIASVLGTLVGLPMIVRGKARAKTKLPFGPFLMTATAITVLFGAQILDWYQRQFLFF